MGEIAMKAARLHPLVAVTRQAIRRGGVHTGEFVPARRRGGACPRCGAPLERTTVYGGPQRRRVEGRVLPGQPLVHAWAMQPHAACQRHGHDDRRATAVTTTAIKAAVRRPSDSAAGPPPAPFMAMASTNGASRKAAAERSRPRLDGVVPREVGEVSWRSVRNGRRWSGCAEWGAACTRLAFGGGRRRPMAPARK
jgi:hypothetical protein